jgi:hypothetical protein
MKQVLLALLLFSCLVSATDCVITSNYIQAEDNSTCDGQLNITNGAVWNTNGYLLSAGTIYVLNGTLVANSSITVNVINSTGATGVVNLSAGANLTFNDVSGCAFLSYGNANIIGTAGTPIYIKSASATPTYPWGFYQANSKTATFTYVNMTGAGTGTAFLIDGKILWNFVNHTSTAAAGNMLGNGVDAGSSINNTLFNSTAATVNGFVYFYNGGACPFYNVTFIKGGLSLRDQTGMIVDGINISGTHVANRLETYQGTVTNLNVSHLYHTSPSIFFWSSRYIATSGTVQITDSIANGTSPQIAVGTATAAGTQTIYMNNVSWGTFFYKVAGANNMNWTSGFVESAKTNNTDVFFTYANGRAVNKSQFRFDYGAADDVIIDNAVINIDEAAAAKSYSFRNYSEPSVTGGVTNATFNGTNFNATGIGIIIYPILAFPSAPTNYPAIKYINVTNITSTGWAVFNITYAHGDWQNVNIINESAMTIWKYQGGVWTDLGGTIDIVNNAITLNVTAANAENSILALMGKTVPIWISQTPADINSTNLVSGALNITYNITGTNSTNVTLYYKTNSSASDCWEWINGTQVCGWQTDEDEISNVSTVWQFLVDENVIYPSTNLLSMDIFEENAHSSTVLKGNNNYLRINIGDIQNTTQYGFLEIMAMNASPSSPPLLIYYCNSSYTTGVITTSPNCAQFGSIAAGTAYNHTHGANVSHQVVSFPVVNGSISGIKITNSSSFMFKAANNINGWNYYHVANLTTASTIQTTTNNGVVWSNEADTVDFHVHQFTANDTFRYIASVTSDGVEYNSTMQNDTLALEPLPPSAPNIITPAADSTWIVTNTMGINYTESSSPAGSVITNYTINLLDSDFTFVKQIHFNALNLTYDWTIDTTGLYTISVTVCNDKGKCATGYRTNITLVQVSVGCNLSINPSSPITYETQSTAVCACTGNRPTHLYRDGILADTDNNTLITLGTGTYFYECNATADANYTAGYNFSTFTVNQYPVACSVNVTPPSPQGYGTATVALCSCDRNFGTTVLYRNATDATFLENNTAAVLNVGTWLYECNSTGNANYSDGNNFTLFTITPGSVFYNVTNVSNNMNLMLQTSSHGNVLLILGIALLIGVVIFFIKG